MQTTLEEPRPSSSLVSSNHSNPSPSLITLKKEVEEPSSSLSAVFGPNDSNSNPDNPEDETTTCSRQETTQVSTQKNNECEEELVDDDPSNFCVICSTKDHNERFMICCDNCEDWFHGACVGVTRSMGGALLEKKLEWFCPRRCDLRYSDINEVLFILPEENVEETQKITNGGDQKLAPKKVVHPKEVDKEVSTSRKGKSLIKPSGPRISKSFQNQVFKELVKTSVAHPKEFVRKEAPTSFSGDQDLVKKNLVIIGKINPVVVLEDLAKRISLSSASNSALKHRSSAAGSHTDARPYSGPRKASHDRPVKDPMSSTNNKQKRQLQAAGTAPPAYIYSKGLLLRKPTAPAATNPLKSVSSRKRVTLAGDVLIPDQHDAVQVPNTSSSPNLEEEPNAMSSLGVEPATITEDVVMMDQQETDQISSGSNDKGSVDLQDGIPVKKRCLEEDVNNLLGHFDVSLQAFGLEQLNGNDLLSILVKCQEEKFALQLDIYANDKLIRGALLEEETARRKRMEQRRNKKKTRQELRNRIQLEKISQLEKQRAISLQIRNLEFEKSVIQQKLTHLQYVEMKKMRPGYSDPSGHGRT